MANFPSLGYLEKFLLQNLHGPHPNHLAFIMDGNRRHAKNQQQLIKTGHQMGLQSLKKILQYTLQLKVKEVTIFAFALENFSRNQQEIDDLMILAKEGLMEMAVQRDWLEGKGVKIRILGDLEKLKPDVREKMQEIMELTQNYSDLQLNVCFAYNSDYELELANGQGGKGIKEFEEGLLVRSYPDLVIRTSNEVRLSNFLTYQSTFSELVFLKENWPEISLYSFLKIIISYQIKYKDLQLLKRKLNP